MKIEKRVDKTATQPLWWHSPTFTFVNSRNFFFFVLGGDYILGQGFLKSFLYRFLSYLKCFILLLSVEHLNTQL